MSYYFLTGDSRNGQFCGFHDILTPITQNPYTVLASNLNSNELYGLAFLRCKEGEHLEGIIEHNQ